MILNIAYYFATAISLVYGNTFLRAFAIIVLILVYGLEHDWFV
ncbi:hypothetical protein phiAS5_ORF0208 [Aeromonas phage phiAS5]|uniref:Uncharacterized protein n=1 Tax=Aeromonas phage phiAS5 TaxID=879630 RepID=E1A2V5_9CAUD|nr:hypothetical protein phiAS5_ORF0208 [Aeromonas phage phiAS5]ADM80051.1 hypothetical protein phiAS5_ORF0208 [Aeromonas phage phiAS5]